MSTQICKFCSKDFIYPSKLKKHQQTTQCRNSDETQISSQNDQTLLTKNKLYICSSCEYSTKFSYNLNRHTKTCMSKVTKSELIKENKILKVMLNKKLQGINEELKTFIRIELENYK